MVVTFSFRALSLALILPSVAAFGDAPLPGIEHPPFDYIDAADGASCPLEQSTEILTFAEGKFCAEGVNVETTYLRVDHPTSGGGLIQEAGTFVFDGVYIGTVFLETFLDSLQSNITAVATPVGFKTSATTRECSGVFPILFNHSMLSCRWAASLSRFVPFLHCLAYHPHDHLVIHLSQELFHVRVKTCLEAPPSRC